MPGDNEIIRRAGDTGTVLSAVEQKKLQAQLAQNSELLAQKEGMLNQALQAKTTLEKEIIGLKNEIAQNSTLLAQKETLLTKAYQSKAALEGENVNLKSEISRKTLQIQSFDQEKALLTAKYVQLSATNRELLNEKETELAKLRAQIDEVSRSNNIDELMVKELTATRLQLQQTDLQNKVNVQTLIECKSALSIRDEQVKKMTLDLEQLSKLAADYQLDKTAVKSELELLRSKLISSYTPEELSAYLGSTIESFNTQVNVSDPSVNYVINSMDIDLKAQVFRDDQSRVKFTPADISSKSENSLSSIKISIRAVPKL